MDATTKQVVVLLFISGVVSSIGVLAQMTDESRVNVSTLTCAALLKADGEDRLNLTVFMHGYISGQREDKTIYGSELSDITGNILDACIAAPDRNLLTVFEEKR